MKARDAMFEFLRAIDLHPIEWSEAIQATEKGAPYIGEALNEAFKRAQAVVVLFTPDDEARLHPALRGKDEPAHEVELTGQPRPNVLLETGMAMGRKEQRTILVQLEKLRPMSDLDGRHFIRLTNSVKRRRELALRLRTAGCPIDLQGTDWHTAGDFDPAFDRGAAREPQPSDDATALLQKAVTDRQRRIIRLPSHGGLRIITAGCEFGRGDGGPEDEVRWDIALDELVEMRMVRHTGGVVYVVTPTGLSFAKE